MTARVGLDPIRKTLYALAMGKDEPKDGGRKLRAGAPTKLIALRVTDEERAEYEAAMKAEGKKSLSDWIRSTLARVLRRKRG